MYYSSESSDSDAGLDKKALDLSYLMLDSTSLAVYLRNSAQEQKDKADADKLAAEQTHNSEEEDLPKIEDKLSVFDSIEL